jgi:hypothetical protein
MEQHGPHWTDFREILYLSSFRKSAEKVHVSLKRDKNNGHFKSGPKYISDYISLNSSYKEKMSIRKL